jgi:hypothetical protein
MKSFKCAWCLPKEEESGATEEGGSTDSGSSNKPFCSDQMGLHRRRQDWIAGKQQQKRGGEESGISKHKELLLQPTAKFRNRTSRSIWGVAGQIIQLFLITFLFKVLQSGGREADKQQQQQHGGNSSRCLHRTYILPIALHMNE